MNTMDINICRAGLTSIAFALTLIVTGCSGQNALNKNHETPSSSNSIEESTEETAQPDKEREPRNTNSSASYDASTTATSEKKYSGGSKAPDGEYRPADEHGPAQNVPVPKIPEGMDVESEEGLEKFLIYWTTTRNYGVETGDTALVRERTSVEYDKGISNFDSWNKLKISGGWNIGGLQEISIDKRKIQELGGGFYKVPKNIQSQDAITVINGEYIAHKLSRQNANTYIAKLQFADNGKWYLINVF